MANFLADGRDRREKPCPTEVDRNPMLPGPRIIPAVAISSGDSTYFTSISEGDCMAVHIEVRRDGEELVVLSPFNEGFVRGAKALGGRFNPDRKFWCFRAEFAAAVNGLLERCYPEEMIKGDYVTVRLTIWQTLRAEGPGGLMMFGRKICGLKQPTGKFFRQPTVIYGNEAETQEMSIGEDVYFLAGSPVLTWSGPRSAIARDYGAFSELSGIKKAIWTIEACPRCPAIIELRHFPRAEYAKWADCNNDLSANARIIVVPDKFERPDFSDPVDQMSQVPPAALLSDEELLGECLRRSLFDSAEFRQRRIL